MLLFLGCMMQFCGRVQVELWQQKKTHHVCVPDVKSLKQSKSFYTTIMTNRSEMKQQHEDQFGMNHNI